MNKQVMIGSVNFSGHEEMYITFMEYLKDTPEKEKYIICDKDKLTIWIIWCEDNLK